MIEQAKRFVNKKAIVRWGVFVGAILFSMVIMEGNFPPFAKLVVAVCTYAVTINFSIPLSIGYIGLTPIVANSTLLDANIGLRPALAAAVIGQALAEVVRPIWRPLAQSEFARPVSWQDRVMLAAFHFANLILAGLTIYPFEGGALTQRVAQTIPNITLKTFIPLFITTIYFTIYLFFSMTYWLVRGAKFRQFFEEASPHLVGIIFFAVPLMLFISSADIGIPAFFLLMVSIATFAILNGRSWLGRYRSEQRMHQFSRHNHISREMRQTLDLDTVLAQIHQMVDRLIPAEQFTLTLQDGEGVWQQSFSAVNEQGNLSIITLPSTDPDDLTRYVVQNNHPLDLTAANIHYTKKHGLELPTPTPRIWYGLPLTASDQKTMGAMVIQRLDSDVSFSQWNREMFQAIASQASASIESARLYGQTDSALSRRLEQLQALLLSIEEGVLMVDTAAKIVLINRTAAHLIGKAWAQLHDSTLNIKDSDALGFSQAELIELLTRLANSENLDTHDSTYTLTTDDQLRYIERHEVAVTSDDGVLMGWLMVFRDVTQARERTAWRQDLTRMIVHDLRNPITTIRNSITLLNDELGDSTATTHLNSANYSCTSLLEMVDSLLDINRAEAGTFVIDAEAMRLPPLVERTVGQLRPLATQRGIVLETNMGEGVPAVWADEEIMRRVLVNLLDNALKFTPRGGRVCVELERASAVPLDNKPLDNKIDDGINVRITDTGPGIPTSQKERIFDRFVTFNPGGGQVRGTGLGLSFCKLAIEAHNSRIWVEDVPDGGSAFVFSVPGIPQFIQ